MPSERRVKLADVDEQDRDLALDARVLLVGVALEQLTQHVVVDITAEGQLDALLLLECVAHLVEGARQLADLVARGGRDTDRHVAGGEPLHADAQAPQRADEQRDEAEPGQHADRHHQHGQRGELLRGAAHHRIDEHAEVELDLRLADEHVAVQHWSRDAQDALFLAHPHAAGRVGVSGQALARQSALAGVARREHAPLAVEQPDGDDARAAADLLDQPVERELASQIAAARARGEQRLLRGSGQVRHERAAALLDLRVERAPLVPRCEHREADAGRHEQGGEQRAELDLERSQRGHTSFGDGRGFHRELEKAAPFLGREYPTGTGRV